MNKELKVKFGRLRMRVLATLGIVLAAGLAVAYASMSDAPAKQNGAQQRRIAVRRSGIFYDVHRFRRISFVVDTCDGMNKLLTLKAEFPQVVTALGPAQSFNISFFGGSFDDLAKCARLDPSELLPATVENRRETSRFLQGVCTTGYRDPTEALESAFQRNPDVIYLLTDGDFSDNDAVLGKIRELNKKKRVKIYTIAMVGETDRDMAYLKLLKRIAAENRGRFRYVREWELQ